MAHLRNVLATREVPTLLGSSMIGRLPTAMATLAVLLLVREQGGDYSLAGALGALFTVGTAIGQPALARVADRRGQRRPVLASAGISTLAFVVLALSGAHHAAVSLVAAAVAGLATPPLEPCLRALWPHVISAPPTLAAAYSLDVGAQELIFVCGPLLTAASIAVGGARGGVLACAVFGIVGSLRFASTRASSSWRPASVRARPSGSPLHYPVLVRTFVVAFGCGLPVGALAIAAADFAALHGDTSITEWTLAANAAGALAAGLYGAQRTVSDTSARSLTRWAFALAAGYLPLAVPVPVWTWLALAALAGAALPVVLSIVFRRLAEHSPAHLITEANAWVVTAFGGGAALAALAAGLVSDQLGARAALTVIVIGGASCTVLAGVAGAVGSAGPARAAAQE